MVRSLFISNKQSYKRIHIIPFVLMKLDPDPEVKTEDCDFMLRCRMNLLRLVEDSVMQDHLGLFPRNENRDGHPILSLSVLHNL